MRHYVIKYNVYGRGCGVNRTINGEPGGRTVNVHLCRAEGEVLMQDYPKTDSINVIQQ